MHGGGEISTKTQRAVVAEVRVSELRDVVVEQDDLDLVLGLNIARALGEVGYDR